MGALVGALSLARGWACCNWWARTYTAVNVLVMGALQRGCNVGGHVIINVNVGGRVGARWCARALVDALQLQLQSILVGALQRVGGHVGAGAATRATRWWTPWTRGWAFACQRIRRWARC